MTQTHSMTEETNERIICNTCVCSSTSSIASLTFGLFCKSHTRHENLHFQHLCCNILFQTNASKYTFDRQDCVTRELVAQHRKLTISTHFYLCS